MPHKPNESMPESVVSTRMNRGVKRIRKMTPPRDPISGKFIKMTHVPARGKFTMESGPPGSRPTQ